MHLHVTPINLYENVLGIQRRAVSYSFVIPPAPSFSSRRFVSGVGNSLTEPQPPLHPLWGVLLTEPQHPLHPLWGVLLTEPQHPLHSLWGVVTYRATAPSLGGVTYRATAPLCTLSGGCYLPSHSPPLHPLWVGVTYRATAPSLGVSLTKPQLWVGVIYRATAPFAPSLGGVTYRATAPFAPSLGGVRLHCCSFLHHHRFFCVCHVVIHFSTRTKNKK